MGTKGTFWGRSHSPILREVSISTTFLAKLAIHTKISLSKIYFQEILEEVHMIFQITFIVCTVYVFIYENVQDSKPATSTDIIGFREACSFPILGGAVYGKEESDR